MFNISDFLEKFKKINQNKTLQTENIKKSIENVIGVQVSIDNFVIKDGVLYIKNLPTLRQEIFLKKNQLLMLIKNDGVFDIR